MSTKERYGNAVWEAACLVGKHGQEFFKPPFTIGEIAECAGVSAPTAKKYLDSLVEAGYVMRRITPNKHRIYQFFQGGD